MRTTATNPILPDDRPRTRATAAINVVSVQHRDLVVLSVEGTIDVLTAPLLTESVTAALAGRPRGLIIDLTDTAFLASAGMSALLVAHASAPTGHFGVVADGPSTGRPLKLVGLHLAMTIYPTLATALAALANVTEVNA
ncbi:STAS domain-containing protein [Nocardia sp. 348MFTsu5.1]|uniref:STAS domain-containing protein n=1 Tax=Nocardia sp. 348MFTsu5.1 TaxID=1172185 RepID=UPI00055B1AC6|nr:STAS domain-containing protein [Nocardia sp. 348MFTsu5.1]